jgi:hypothetical protein
MSLDDKILDTGGAVAIKEGDRVVRLASIDGTRNTELLALLRSLLDAAREEGRKMAAKAA